MLKRTSLRLKSIATRSNMRSTSIPTRIAGVLSRLNSRNVCGSANTIGILPIRILPIRILGTKLASPGMDLPVTLISSPVGPAGLDPFSTLRSAGLPIVFSAPVSMIATTLMPLTDASVTTSWPKRRRAVTVIVSPSSKGWFLSRVSVMLWRLKSRMTLRPCSMSVPRKPVEPSDAAGSTAVSISRCSAVPAFI